MLEEIIKIKFKIGSNTMENGISKHYLCVANAHCTNYIGATFDFK